MYSTGLTPLPIDGRIDDIVNALASRSGATVVVAEPGAGKTTRVPRAMLDAGLAGPGEIWVTEPRRLAARMAAARVSEELGEKTGRTVGYQVRFEEAAGPETRVRFVTEGILIRRLFSDPTLSGTAAVILDEFHERHLDSDLALSLLNRLRKNERPDLKVAVMSATLQAQPVAAFLDCDVIEVEGRLFDVAVVHQDYPDKRNLELQVASAVRRLISEGLDGDVLVFLPGAAEIRRARDACAPIADKADLELTMLHGDLPSAEQDRAVRAGQRRKIILSTNVAETSITIPSVTAVIDSGLARIARVAPWSGLRQLETARISRGSATQRAGRAGRVRPGRAVRLYTRHDHNTRPEHDVPEILRADLCTLSLMLRAGGYGDPRAFPFFDPPPGPAVDAAETLLLRLGALGKAGPEPDRPAVTELGREMAALPLHPRLSRLALMAARRGVRALGCLAAALIQEREIRTYVRTRLTKDGPAAVDQSGRSDVLAQMDAFMAAENEGLRRDRIRAHGLDHSAVRTAARARDQIAAALRGKGTDAADLSEEQAEHALLLATLAAFPDRVGRRRKPAVDEVVFAAGGSARLSPSSVVREAEFLVAVSADQKKKGSTVIRTASAIEPEWLLELFENRIEDRTEIVFNPETERVEEISEMAYEGLVLDRRTRPNPEGPEPDRVLARALLSAGPGAVCDAEALDQFRQRVAFAARFIPDLEPVTDEMLEAIMVSFCQRKRSFAELRLVSLIDFLKHTHCGPALSRVERLAPDTVSIPGRRRVKVRYDPARPPWIESRLQDFFGTVEGPRIADGRVPLTLHLLAPNKRAVQVTTDLAGFWTNHYPSVRKELMRRYPKHGWPEDPRTSAPTRPGRRKKKK